MNFKDCVPNTPCGRAPTDKEILEQEKRFKKQVFDSFSMIRRDTSNIIDVNDIQDHNKGGWIEHDEIQEVFDGLLDFTFDENEIDNLDWNSVNFVEAYNAQYYRERFPGFADPVYEILEKAHKEDNL
jgi:hypothetical protein